MNVINIIIVDGPLRQQQAGANRLKTAHNDRLGKKCARIVAGEAQRSVSVRIRRVKAEKIAFQAATGTIRRRRRRLGRLDCPACDACGTATEAVGRSARSFYRDPRRAVCVTFFVFFQFWAARMPPAGTHRRALCQIIPSRTC